MKNYYKLTTKEEIANAIPEIQDDVYPPTLDALKAVLKLGSIHAVMPKWKSALMSYYKTAAYQKYGDDCVANLAIIMDEIGQPYEIVETWAGDQIEIK